MIFKAIPDFLHPVVLCPSAVPAIAECGNGLGAAASS